MEIPVGLRLPRPGGCPEARHLARERATALRAAVARLPTRCARLMAAQLDDPGADYGSLAETLNIPRGSIGPTRSRCLACLRRMLNPDI
ncbi:sigma-70 family RNA polymerase sigma factor [Streptacidiphilus jiangxiensis]|uniref:Sigma-70, region 4 n=1 Tax=Streptacidiphilus jiangxiensis TaxID=235985 RepID=A0A1H7XIN6_STRJI|nr:sigma-70 family RNA polymerase sigma factor [Streptacidiphilus jiangxiensis]SEM33037.1 hypothetical protein SAMN05414137_12416 [Streptacidiphilus jiangxiensis]